MVVAWLGLIPCAIFSARYLRSAWPEKSWIGLKIWFHVGKDRCIVKCSSVFDLDSPNSECCCRLADYCFHRNGLLRTRQMDRTLVWQEHNGQHFLWSMAFICKQIELARKNQIQVQYFGCFSGRAATLQCPSSVSTGPSPEATFQLDAQNHWICSLLVCQFVHSFYVIS